MTIGITASPRRTFPWLVAAAAVIGAMLYIELPALAALLTYGALGLPRGTHLATSVEFFIYETP